MADPENGIGIERAELCSGSHTERWVRAVMDEYSADVWALYGL